MRKLNIFICIVMITGFFITVPPAPASEGSLWARREKRSGELFKDNIAASKGDTLTVLISEESSFSKQGDRDMHKSSSASASAGLQSTLDDPRDFDGSINKSSDRQFQGSESHSGSREFVDSITVTVIDVLPNGNLVIAGRSERNIANEKVKTVISGVTRPTDISGDNTVASSSLANLNVHYETKESSYMKEGWINVILNLVWPF